jgi:hypothetical protein
MERLKETAFIWKVQNPEADLQNRVLCEISRVVHPGDRNPKLQTCAD